LGSALYDTSLELRDVDANTGVAQLWIGQHLVILLFACVGNEECWQCCRKLLITDD